MQLLTFTILGALAAQAAAVPFTTTHAVHERRDYIPEAWIKKGRIDSAAEIPARIGLTQSNLHKGHDLLMDV